MRGSGDVLGRGGWWIGWRGFAGLGVRGRRSGGVCGLVGFRRWCRRVWWEWEWGRRLVLGWMPLCSSVEGKRFGRVSYGDRLRSNWGNVLALGLESDQKSPEQLLVVAL